MSPTFDPPAAAGGTLPRNRILAALPREERERLQPHLKEVELNRRQVIVSPCRPIEHVYFPEDSVVSINERTEDGSAIETATVGNEGMVGVPVYLGAMQMTGQASVQVRGRAWGMPAGALREEIRRGGTLAELLGRYTQALFTLVAQASVCNRKHAVEERCARWLLMAHDRVRGDTFELTHLVLSQTQGIRRASVSEVAARLRERGLIEYARGRITIVDRTALEATACTCYGIIRAEFARLLDGRGLPGAPDGA